MSEFLKFNMKLRKAHLSRPVDPMGVDPTDNASELTRKMGRTAFQGKNLSRAVDVWEEMLKHRTTIFFGLAGAMVPAGMRSIIVHLIENRFIDCLVSTGANLFHDIHETLGFHHWQGSHNVDDDELRRAGLDRMYDVYGIEEEFNDSDKYIFEFAEGLEARPYTTREFFHLMGEDLNSRGKVDGIVTAAARSGVPIYCPAVADSSIAIALAMKDGKEHFLFDVVGDVKETAELASRARSSGVIFIGGGTPKNFIQQTEVTAALMGKKAPGHKYAIQITADAPHWGGLSGCTFSEAASWGKIARHSKRVTLHCDTTIALPMIVTAVSGRVDGLERRLPKLDLSRAHKVKEVLWDKKPEYYHA